MADYMPKTDPGFREWIENFVTYAGAHAAELGLAADQIAEMQAVRVAFVNAYIAYQAAQDAAKGATENKEEKRAQAEVVMRKYVNILQVSPEVSDPERLVLRITVRDKEPTPTDPTAILRVILPRVRTGTPLVFPQKRQDTRRSGYQNTDKCGSRLHRQNGQTGLFFPP